jgi:hypothetical protein
MADLAALTAAIEAGDRATATAVTQEAVDEGMDPRTVLLDARASPVRFLIRDRDATFSR